MTSISSTRGVMVEMKNSTFCNYSVVVVCQKDEDMVASKGRFVNERSLRVGSCLITYKVVTSEPVTSLRSRTTRIANNLATLRQNELPTHLKFLFSLKKKRNGAVENFLGISYNTWPRTQMME